MLTCLHTCNPLQLSQYKSSQTLPVPATGLSSGLFNCSGLRDSFQVNLSVLYAFDFCKKPHYTNEDETGVHLKNLCKRFQSEPGWLGRASGVKA